MTDSTNNDAKSTAIFEISVAYTQFSVIRVRASSLDAAISHLQEDPSWTDDVNWNDGDPEWQYNGLETYEDGEAFDIDIHTDEADGIDEGTLVFHAGPENGILVVTDAAGQRHEISLKGKSIVAAGDCSWDLVIDGEITTSGTFNVWPNEYNPIVVK